MLLLNYTAIGFYLLSTGFYLAFLLWQKQWPQRAGFYLMLAGAVLHTVAMITGIVRTGVIPVHNLHQTLSIAAWSVALVFLFFQYRFNLKVLGVYAAPLVAVTLIAATTMPHATAKSPVLLNNAWLVVHIVIVFLGEAFLALACGAGILYLMQEHAIKSKQQGFFYSRLPSLERLDNAGYTTIVSGFTLMTIGLVTGFIYAQSIWGRMWSWDPKEVWASITWLIYAALVHQRLTVGWRGRRAAILAIIGFLILVFTFLGVNFLFKGHHGEFTRF